MQIYIQSYNNNNNNNRFYFHIFIVIISKIFLKYTIHEIRSHKKFLNKIFFQDQESSQDPRAFVPQTTKVQSRPLKCLIYTKYNVCQRLEVSVHFLRVVGYLFNFVRGFNSVCKTSSNIVLRQFNTILITLSN